jgi:hypothetical protein
MAGDLVVNGFQLPASASYNGADIPFAYPPLALYVTAALSQLTGLSPVEILRWLPAIIATATVPALYVLARELLRSPWRALTAAAGFALMPRAFEWLVVGGGVTRGMGLLFALLALREGIVLMRGGRLSRVITTGLLAAATALAHPQAAVFVTFSLALLLVFHLPAGRRLRPIVQLVSAAAVSFLVLLPWLVSVIALHGFAPLLSAGRTGTDVGAGISQLLGLAFVDTPVLDVIAALSLVGIFLRFARGQFLMPGWLLVIVMVDPRAGATFATVPLAMSLPPIIEELVHRTLRRKEHFSLADTPLPSLVREHWSVSILVLLLLFSGLRTATRSAVDPESPLHVLTADHVTALRWIDANRDPRDGFAVVTDRTWESDYLSEWFPVIAHRVSVATVQGSEWRGVDAFIGQLAKYRQLQRCAVDTATCVSDWATGWEVEGALVFVPKGQLYGPGSPDDCCPGLRETLAEPESGYVVVYDGPGATIFAPQPPT